MPAQRFAALLLLLLAAAAVASALLDEASLPEFYAQLVEWRRHLHQYPELGYKENITSTYIRQQLDDMDIPYNYPVAKTGIVATIKGAKPGPMVALRADMDALPIEEETGLPFSSKHAGRMHACGHDAHVAMLLGAARLLARRQSELHGSVRLVFQPAEEGGGGARQMIEEDALEGVEAIFGLHGSVATRAGAIMAASDRFEIVVTGRGGHGALPHLAVDPVVCASAIVMGLQPLVSRETRATDAAVLSVTKFNTVSSAFNVIGDSVTLGGTLRALSEETFGALHVRIAQVAALTAQAHGCNTSITWGEVPYPPTINNAGMAHLVREAAAGLVGEQQLLWLPEPSMPAEDFSFYGQQVKAAFSFLGLADAEKGPWFNLHNPRFLMNEEVMPLGAALHATLAMEFLDRARSEASNEAAASAGAADGGQQCGAASGAESAAGGSCSL